MDSTVLCRRYKGMNMLQPMGCPIMFRLASFVFFLTVFLNAGISGSGLAEAQGELGIMQSNADTWYMAYGPMERKQSKGLVVR